MADVSATGGSKQKWNRKRNTRESFIGSDYGAAMKYFRKGENVRKDAPTFPVFFPARGKFTRNLSPDIYPSDDEENNPREQLQQLQPWYFRGIHSVFVFYQLTFICIVCVALVNFAPTCKAKSENRRVKGVQLTLDVDDQSLVEVTQTLTRQTEGTALAIIFSKELMNAGRFIHCRSCPSDQCGGARKQIKSPEFHPDLVEVDAGVNYA
ncbi:hypothetical protein KQX54_019718 [Cotesia glomerata]|uniref:Uncharacterized protein n=1 Tax=Cotesia glomerata TaxID=32391 RepID=A0AAV7J1Y0_COTGL|nr:hypothetical protein KQX54_019718 [Cotesia glomerata]